MIHLKPMLDYATSLLKSLQGAPTSFRTKAKVLNDGLQGPSQSISHILSQTATPLWHQLHLSLPGLLLQPAGHLTVPRTCQGCRWLRPLLFYIRLLTLFHPLCMALSRTSLRPLHKGHPHSKAWAIFLFKAGPFLCLILFHSTCHHLTFIYCTFVLVSPLECKLQESWTSVSCVPTTVPGTWQELSKYLLS